MIRTATFVLLLVSGVASAAESYTWWVDPCTPDLARSTACQAGDGQLAQWALEAWQRESNGALKFIKAESSERAEIRLHWVNANSGLYGETEPFVAAGHRGANIYVVPSVANPSNPLMRDAVVYLTCVHESGHALGLEHTRQFDDIMYSFAYGGDIESYFQRYRDLLHKRTDIALHSGVSDHDRAVLRLLYH